MKGVRWAEPDRTIQCWAERDRTILCRVRTVMSWVKPSHTVSHQTKRTAPGWGSFSKLSSPWVVSRLRSHRSRLWRWCMETTSSPQRTARAPSASGKKEGIKGNKTGEKNGVKRGTVDTRGKRTRETKEISQERKEVGTGSRKAKMADCPTDATRWRYVQPSLRSLFATILRTSTWATTTKNWLFGPEICTPSHTPSGTTSDATNSTQPLA